MSSRPVVQQAARTSVDLLRDVQSRFVHEGSSRVLQKRAAPMEPRCGLLHLQVSLNIQRNVYAYLKVFTRIRNRFIRNDW